MRTATVRGPCLAKRIRTGTVWLLALMLLASCGRAVAPGTGSPSPSGGQLQVAGDSDNGSTKELRVGDRLEVGLHSTYWTIKGSSNPQVLLAEGPVVVSSSRTGCVPGGGCGRVAMIFDVVGAGSADVTAARTSCGEAMACTGSEGSYKITVVATS